MNERTQHEQEVSVAPRTAMVGAVPSTNTVVAVAAADAAVSGHAVADGVSAGAPTSVNAGGDVAPADAVPASCAVPRSDFSATSSDPPALEVTRLTFTYPGAEIPVLSECSFSVEQGAFALLVGDTGSGKSTLLSLCKPQIAPAGVRSGGIRVLGTPVERIGDARSARDIGYVFQNPETQIVCESVWHEMAFGLENLGVPQGEMRRLVAETSYFFGMEEWFRDQTDTLSGGRKQLLALASVLVMQPKILLLDEPTAMLDPIAEKNFLHALFRINRELGCTVVVATHRPEPMLEYATCTYRLEAGAIARAKRAIGDSPLLHTNEAGTRAIDGPEGLAAAPAPQGKASAGDAALKPKNQAIRGGHRPRATKAKPCVSLNRAWFRYGHDTPWVLRNLDFELREGAIHALVGGNGCGKSTLLSLIAKTNKLQRGSFKRNVGATAFLPQNPRALFVEETVWAELMEWAKAASYGDTQVEEMLSRMGLLGFESQHPYDLSGGQQQLLAMAKLLLIKPNLLLLDEPTKGLDVSARQKIAEELQTFTQAGGTVLMASHDLAFVRDVATATSMMFDGEIACTEPTAQFFKHNVYYRP